MGGAPKQNQPGRECKKWAWGTYNVMREATEVSRGIRTVLQDRCSYLPT